VNTFFSSASTYTTKPTTLGMNELERGAFSAQYDDSAARSGLAGRFEMIGGEHLRIAAVRQHRTGCKPRKVPLKSHRAKLIGLPMIRTLPHK
jgi:hypothetical protein